MEHQLTYSTLSTVWCQLDHNSRVLIITDDKRYDIASDIQRDNLSHVSSIHIINLDREPRGYVEEMQQLEPQDLLLVLLSISSYMEKGYNNVFPAFQKPQNLRAKYVMVRLDIPARSLLTGLNTPLEKVQAIIARLKSVPPNSQVRIITESGTDVITQVRDFKVLPFHILNPGDNAYLPPAEIYTSLVENSTNGQIVVDVTVGELRVQGQLIDELGLVDEPVTLTIKDGALQSITGGAIAQRLRDELDKLPDSCKIVVELGHGLSNLEPTGIIGVDESMNDTCHFGIGDNIFYGGQNVAPIHLDVVLKNPQLQHR